MTLRRLMSIRGIAIALGVLLIAVAAYGFAASNDVPETGAGDGAGTISGYDISEVTYTLDDPTPTTIVQVDFTLDSTTGNAGLPANVHVQLVDPAGAWHECTTTDVTLPAAYECAISPAVNVADANQLRVVAAE